MSSMPQGFPSASDDARLELSMAAMRAERRNRPRALPILALLVLIAAGLYLAWSFTVRAAAGARLNRATSSLASIEGVVTQLRSMQEQRNDPRFEPANDLVGRLQRFANEGIGLPRPQVQERSPTTSANVKGFIKRLYTTEIRDADPDLLLRWVIECTDGKNFPGLEIDQMKLTPGRTMEDGRVAWSLDIAFRRWERQP